MLVNTLPVTRGGGLQNIRNLWTAAGRDGEGDEWMFVARPESGLADAGPDVAWRHCTYFPIQGFGHRLKIENVAVPKLARTWGADLVFTPMGAGPVRCGCPTVMGWHDPSAGYPESPMWARAGFRFRNMERLRRRYARAAASRALRVCTQTASLADRIAKHWQIDRGRFRIIPNGPSSFHQSEEPAPEPPRGDPKIVLVLGNPKPIKNFEVVPRVAAALSATELCDVEVHATLSDDDVFMDRYLRQEVAVGPTRIPIRKIGLIPHAELGRLYRRSAVVFLPSLLETFSATYIEAMHFGVPLVTSDLDFAREICGDAALYADPLDPRACAAAIHTALTDTRLRHALREAGFARVKTFPDWSERFALYREACREAVIEAAGRN